MSRFTFKKFICRSKIFGYLGKELNYAKVLHPEYTCLSPWDSNLSFFEENSANMIAFHFHALEISSNEFSTGFNKYNKKSQMN